MRILSIFLTAICLFAARADAQTNNLSDAEIQGRALAQEVLAQRPDQSSTTTGVLDIRDDSGKHAVVPVALEVHPTASGWTAMYTTNPTNRIEGDATFGRAYFCQLTIIHADGQPNVYEMPNVNAPPTDTNRFYHLIGDQLNVPFATSDFWLGDLGLEFLHWPQQKVLPKKTTLKRGREYTLLESTNPHPTPNGYSRVVTAIDKESNGVLEAEAYDAKGNLLKFFEPKDLQKVNGQYQLQSMIMENRQTHSRTILRFDLGQ